MVSKIKTKKATPLKARFQCNYRLLIYPISIHGLYLIKFDIKRKGFLPSNRNTKGTLDNTPFNLIQFNRLKQRLEISLTKPLIAFALNKFKENRPDHIGRKNL